MRRRGMLALVLGLALPAMAGADETGTDGGVGAFLRALDAAFSTGEVGRLSPFYHPDVTIFEGSI